MVTDHSKTYQLTDIRNLVHLMRLRAIMRTLHQRIRTPIHSFADFGCSNGYITSKVASRLKIERVDGYDFTDNVLVGAELHPEINFKRFNLNNKAPSLEKYDLVTCFETLEHVGNMESAIYNVVQSCAKGGFILITVPIEIGWIGVVKYLAKRFLFRYDLELNCTDRQYFSALLKREPIGRFRPPLQGYGTHFGFDYREVDDILGRYVRSYESWNSGTSRFYFVSL